MKEVSVILLCYNHAKFIEQSIRSVLEQDYPDLELIVVDDNSTDNSWEKIKELQDQGLNFQSIRNPENYGNCRSFNIGFAKSSGKHIIDLAADDYFLPTKIKKQIDKFKDLTEDYGIVSSDAYMVDENGNTTGTHLDKIRRIGKYKAIPEGNIFRDLLSSFIISSPTQMIKREVLLELNGYDESLNYEDFDFWIRSSKKWKYAFVNEPLMGVRKLSGGMSSDMYGTNDPKVDSTFQIVVKARELLEGEGDHKALIERIRYELRMSFKYRNKRMAKKWYRLLLEEGGSNLFYSIISKL